MYSLYTPLLSLRERYPKLVKEIGRMRKENAMYISAKANLFNIEIYKHIDELRRTEFVSLILRMIGGLRNGKPNFAGYGRKIVILAHKPINLAILFVVSEHLEKQCTRKPY